MRTSCSRRRSTSRTRCPPTRHERDEPGGSYPSVDDNGALWDKQTGAPSKRLWVMGNFSRFVRPGFRRITTKTAPPDGVLLSAHRNPADGTVVVVAANTTATATTLSLFIPGTPACSYTPYVTSESESLAQRTAVTVSSGRLSLSLPPLSVTSLVGQP